MSRTTRSGAGPAPPALGLPAASALVIGSIIGTGVFALPSALAPYGPISLVAFVAVTVGALALAVTFGALSKRVPASGGPYAHAREAFREFAGFLNAWSYWITAWAGNAAIVVAWVGYVEVFVNTGHRTGISVLIALVGLWIPAAINLTGVRNIGVFQVITTVLSAQAGHRDRHHRRGRARPRPGRPALHELPDRTRPGRLIPHHEDPSWPSPRPSTCEAAPT